MTTRIKLAAAMLMATAAFARGALIAPGAKVEKLAGGFKFTEGPAADAEGNVFFSDIPNRRIHKWSVDGKLSTFREQSGGSNGLYFDRNGNLIACEGVARRLTSTAADGKVTVLADEHDGKKFNSPNDLWIDPKGGIYFTDPRYGRRDDIRQDGMHVYYLTPDRKKLIRVVDDMVRPNGVIGTADGQRLYIADEGGRKIWTYAIKPGGTLTDKKLFTEQRSDGMTLDEKGNLYVTLKGVHVFSPEGKKIETIDIPERSSNVCFGGKDRKTLFVTARKSIYAVRMNVRGQ